MIQEELVSQFKEIMDIFKLTNLIAAILFDRQQYTIYTIECFYTIQNTKLIQAARDGEVSDVQQALNDGADVNYYEPFGVSL